MRAFLTDPAHGAGQFRLIPVLRARVTGVSGRETDLESFEDVRARGSLAREYTITYRDHLEANETRHRRQFWNGPSTEPEVSIEKGIRDRFQIGVGDTVRFDILGRVINARGHQRPRGGLEGLAERRLHVRLPAGRARHRRRRRSSRRSRARTAPRRARGFSTTSSSSFRTCRSSTSTRSWRPFAT